MIYTIKKDRHWACPPRVRLYWRKKLWKWTCMLSATCLYDEKEFPGHNKLVGVGQLPSHHHNSIRLSWKRLPMFSAFSLHAYYYQDKKRLWSPPLLVICPNQWFDIEIEGRSTGCFLTITTSTQKISYGISNYQVAKLTYGMNPYFGGPRPAPHKMFIGLTQMY